MNIFNMGIARIFQREGGGGVGHTESYIGYSPDCHLNIVGCLLTKRLTKGGSQAPQDLLATPLLNFLILDSFTNDRYNLHYKHASTVTYFVYSNRCSKATILSQLRIEMNL